MTSPTPTLTDERLTQANDLYRIAMYGDRGNSTAMMDRIRAILAANEAAPSAAPLTEREQAKHARPPSDVEPWVVADDEGLRLTFRTEDAAWRYRNENTDRLTNPTVTYEPASPSVTAAAAEGLTDFYLIERGPNQGHPRHEWWNNSADGVVCGWKSSVHEATQYATKEAAERVVRSNVGLNLIGCVVTSHGLLSAASPSVEGAGSEQNPLDNTQAELDAVTREMDVIYERWPGKDNREQREALLPPLRARCVEIGQRRYRIVAAAPASPSPAGQSEPCPRGRLQQPEPSCTNRHQCWEPCGEMGKSEKHVRVGKEQNLRAKLAGPCEPVAAPYLMTALACGGLQLLDAKTVAMSEEDLARFAQCVAASPAGVQGDGVRMLTEDEAKDCMEWTLLASEVVAIQRKFCEVNGLPLPAGRAGAEGGDGKGWCTSCGCGNDAAGYAHAPLCQRTPSPHQDTAPAEGRGEATTDGGRAQ